MGSSKLGGIQSRYTLDSELLTSPSEVLLAQEVGSHLDGPHDGHLEDQVVGNPYKQSILERAQA